MLMIEVVMGLVAASFVAVPVALAMFAKPAADTKVEQNQVG
jgi:ABC-type nitrate/sulfonate/bicarbonate transport system permease component